MERRLSRGASQFLAFALVGRGLWSAGWVAVRRLCATRGQTDIRGFGVPQDHGSSWGSRCLRSGVASPRGAVAHS